MPAPSKIAKLPPATRQWLHQAIVERAFGDIVGLTDELNALCKEGGVAVTVGKSAVGEESKRLKRAQEAIRATTEAARLIAETSPDEGDNRSAGAMAIVQSEVFELLLQVRESEAVTDPLARLAVMNEAALGLSRLSRSRVNQARWNDELTLRARAAADKISKLARKGGADEKTIAEIRNSVLGIVKKTPQTEAVNG